METATKTAKRRRKATPQPITHLDVKCSPEDKDLVKRAALAAGITRPNGEPNVAQWIMQTIRREAHREIRKAGQ